MPLKSFGCSICGRQAPTEYRQDGKFKERMSWLRRHYKRFHPKKFREMYKR